MLGIVPCAVDVLQQHKGPDFPSIWGGQTITLSRWCQVVRNAVKKNKAEERALVPEGRGLGEVLFLQRGREENLW